MFRELASEDWQRGSRERDGIASAQPQAAAAAPGARASRRMIHTIDIDTGGSTVLSLCSVLPTPTRRRSPLVGPCALFMIDSNFFYVLVRYEPRAERRYVTAFTAHIQIGLWHTRTSRSARTTEHATGARDAREARVLGTGSSLSLVSLSGHAGSRRGARPARHVALWAAREPRVSASRPACAWACRSLRVARVHRHGQCLTL